MTDEIKEEFSHEKDREENNEEQPMMTESEKEKKESEQENEVEQLNKQLEELNNKYVRLYADFENYKRLAAKDKEEVIRYSQEELIKELLSVIDHLELALQHAASADNTSALAKGVEMTLKEMKTSLEKFNLVGIESLGKPFDPSVHHAISQIESEKEDENIIVAEFRKGYKLRDRVLRAALVGVSKKPSGKDKEKKVESEETRDERGKPKTQTKKNRETKIEIEED
jgi:molecular chaperone GrpE